MKKVIIGFAVVGVWLYFSLPKIQYQGGRGPRTVAVACDNVPFLLELALLTTDSEGNEYPCLTARTEVTQRPRRICELDDRGDQQFVVKHKDKVLAQFDMKNLPDRIFVAENLEVVNKWVPISAQRSATSQTTKKRGARHQPYVLRLKTLDQGRMIECLFLDEDPQHLTAIGGTAGQDGTVEFHAELSEGENWVILRELGEEIMPGVMACGPLRSVAKISLNEAEINIGRRQVLPLNVYHFLGKDVVIDQSSINKADREGAVAFAPFPLAYQQEQDFAVWGKGFFQARQKGESDLLRLSLIFEGGLVGIYYPRREKFWVSTATADDGTTGSVLRVNDLDGRLRVDVKGLAAKSLSTCALALVDVFKQSFQIRKTHIDRPGGSHNVTINNTKAISIGADGSFLIDPLPAGPYGLRLLSPNKVLARGRVVVSSGGSTEFTFDL